MYLETVQKLTENTHTTANSNHLRMHAIHKLFQIMNKMFGSKCHKNVFGAKNDFGAARTVSKVLIYDLDNHRICRAHEIERRNDWESTEKSIHRSSTTFTIIISILHCLPPNSFIHSILNFLSVALGPVWRQSNLYQYQYRIHIRITFTPCPNRAAVGR